MTLQQKRGLQAAIIGPLLVDLKHNTAVAAGFLRQVEVEEGLRKVFGMFAESRRGRFTSVLEKDKADILTLGVGRVSHALR